MATTILVVDDEPRILDVVRRYLERDGFVVRVARDGQEALDVFRASRPAPALVVLDLMLPRVDGWHVCRELRRESSVPIVMLTARADESDTLLGLDLGADDYITKPFSPRELVARVRTVLRRAGATAAPAAGSVAAAAPLVVGSLVVDDARHEATWAGERLPLTPAEYRLLDVLARERGRVLNRGQLVDLALGEAFDGYDRTVDAHIKNLRHKLRDHGAGDPIETVRGFGYRFAAPDVGHGSAAGAEPATARAAEGLVDDVA